MHQVIDSNPFVERLDCADESMQKRTYRCGCFADPEWRATGPENQSEPRFVSRSILINHQAYLDLEQPLRSALRCVHLLVVKKKLYDLYPTVIL